MYWKLSNDNIIRTILINNWYFFLYRVINRRCTNHTTVKGIDIPVGTIIAPDVMSIHFDPENWGEVDPNVFYPMRYGSFLIFYCYYMLNWWLWYRFSPDYKRNKAAFMPFGYGPMMCVGKLSNVSF